MHFILFLNDPLNESTCLIFSHTLVFYALENLLVVLCVWSFLACQISDRATVT